MHDSFLFKFVFSVANLKTHSEIFFSVEYLFSACTYSFTTNLRLHVESIPETAVCIWVCFCKPYRKHLLNQHISNLMARSGELWMQMICCLLRTIHIGVIKFSVKCLINSIVLPCWLVQFWHFLRQVSILMNLISWENSWATQYRIIDSGTNFFVAYDSRTHFWVRYP